MQTVALLLSLAPLALALPHEDAVTGPGHQEDFVTGPSHQGHHEDFVTGPGPQGDVVTGPGPQGGVVTGPPAPAPTVTAAPTGTADYSDYAPPSSVPAQDIISALYGTSIPPQVTGAVATSLASALYSQAAEWQTDGKYVSLANVVYMAAATASPSVTDFGLDGLNAPFTTASWYKTGVPKSVQTEVESYYRDLAAVPQSVFSAAGVTVASPTPLGTSGAKASASDNGASAASNPKPTGSASGDDFSGSGSVDSEDHSGSGSENSAALNSPDDSGAVTVTGTALAGVVAAVAIGIVAAL